MIEKEDKENPDKKKNTPLNVRGKNCNWSGSL